MRLGSASSGVQRTGWCLWKGGGQMVKVCLRWAGARSISWIGPFFQRGPRPCAPMTGCDNSQSKHRRQVPHGLHLFTQRAVPYTTRTQRSLERRPPRDIKLFGRPCHVIRRRTTAPALARDYILCTLRLDQHPTSSHIYHSLRTAAGLSQPHPGLPSHKRTLFALPGPIA